ncbi:App1 family protein [Luteolibacter sp. AS25]|uniref:App1 family protein n=1 Tax=Luteolibacter sp. AS25 TaxID=3135776 RepID=UPI00398AD167
MGISKNLHLAAVAVEELLDGARRFVWKRTGRHRPRQIVAYRGYGNSSAVKISGRLLANKPTGGPLEKDGWWKNLVNTYRRWESDEVPFTKVTVSYGENETEITTDEEGYYVVEFPRELDARTELVWRSASASCSAGECEIESVHEIMISPVSPEFGVISDMDDTVIHTGITSILLAAKLTFMENAKTRKPLDGVAGLYRSLQNGNFSVATNPIFYVSSSPWNLHDLITDFMDLNDIPPGPLLLRDIGLDRTKFIKSKGHGHKYDKALSILDEFPDLEFLLIGDSGQDDPTIYADLVEARPGRVKAIYIRDIDPDLDSELDRKVHEAVERASQSGVPMMLVRDSVEISHHARHLGLIPEPDLEAVEESAARDQTRPEAGEQAIKDAFQSSQNMEETDA